LGKPLDSMALYNDHYLGMRETILVSLGLLMLLVVPTSHVLAQVPGLNFTTNSGERQLANSSSSSKQQAIVNFTQLFSTRDFGCRVMISNTSGVQCPPPVRVLYQGANLLVMESDILTNSHLIWSAVAVAKSYGYKVDNMAYAAYHVPAGHGFDLENVIVMMSK
jgi:hypothetical protein